MLKQIAEPLLYNLVAEARDDDWSLPGDEIRRREIAAEAELRRETDERGETPPPPSIGA